MRGKMRLIKVTTGWKLPFAPITPFRFEVRLKNRCRCYECQRHIKDDDQALLKDNNTILDKKKAAIKGDGPAEFGLRNIKVLCRACFKDGKDIQPGIKSIHHRVIVKYA